jgi:hypothetical protein
MADTLQDYKCFYLHLEQMKHTFYAQYNLFTSGMVLGKVTYKTRNNVSTLPNLWPAFRIYRLSPRTHSKLTEVSFSE